MNMRPLERAEQRELIYLSVESRAKEKGWPMRTARLRKAVTILTRKIGERYFGQFDGATYLVIGNDEIDAAYRAASATGRGGKRRTE